MLKEEILDTLKESLELNVAVPVAAMNCLSKVIASSKATTWMGLEVELTDAIRVLKQCHSKASDMGSPSPLYTCAFRS